MSNSAAFMAPSVTPWYPRSVEGGTGINPSIRLYKYNWLSIIDYVQYHLNLTKINSMVEFCSVISINNSENVGDQCEIPEFEEYYKASEFFNVKSLSVQDLIKSFDKLFKNESFFQTYYAINSAGYEPHYCDDTCRRNFLCTIIFLETSSLVHCLNDSTNQVLSSVAFNLSKFSNSDQNVNDVKKITPLFTNGLSTRAPPVLYPTSVPVNKKQPKSTSFMALTVAITSIISIIMLFIGIVAIAFAYKRKNILNTASRFREWNQHHSSDGYQPLNFEAD